MDHLLSIQNFYIERVSISVSPKGRQDGQSRWPNFGRIEQFLKAHIENSLVNDPKSCISWFLSTKSKHKTALLGGFDMGDYLIW